MRDYGNEAAEKAIKELNKKIQEVYGEAERDLQEKMDDFVRKYKIKEKKYLEQLEAGSITQADFDAWKQGQIFQGRQWRTKQRSIADVLHRSNEVSTRMINDMALGVCAENVNWASYTIEQGFGINFGFNIYDETTVANLIKKEPDVLPKWKIDQHKDYVWNKKKLNNAVTQGIIQGEKLDEIAKRVADGLCGSNKNLMKTFATTAMTGAQNAGRDISYKNAQKLGINLKKEWVATLDMRTRSSHRKLDGQKADIDEPFKSEFGDIMFPGDPHADAADVYNCFVGETIVSADSKIVRSYKHEYIGELITVKTSRGVEFTCTPNHPILTPSGWVGAALLNNGDNILVASVGNRINSRWYPDVKHVHSRIDTIHKFGDIFGGHRTCALNVDFHGDIPTSDVEIVTHKGLLRNGRNVGGCKSVNKFLLKITDKAFTSQSAFVKHFWGVCLSTLGFICRRSKALAFFLRRLAHPNIHGFGAVPNMNSVFSENAVDDLSADAVVGGKPLNGLSGNVFIDNIIGVNKVVSNCHVYNLQTENNYYFVNSIAQNGEKGNGIYAIAHNCRCTMIADLVDYPAEEYERYDNIDGKPIKGMSYKEWAEAKKNGEDITIKPNAKRKNKKRSVGKEVVAGVVANTIEKAIEKQVGNKRGDKSWQKGR